MKSKSVEKEPKIKKDSNQEGSFDENKIQIEVEAIGAIDDWAVIGMAYTYLALKNPSSYAIVSSWRGLKIVENGVLRYSAIFPQNEGQVTEISYISHLDCYLLNYDRKLYRKDIDENPPYLYIQREGEPVLAWSSFGYSNLHKRLLMVTESRKTLSVVDLDRRRVEMEVSRSQVDKIQDFKLFGFDQNQVVLLTTFGSIFLFTLKFDLKKVCAEKACKVKLLGDRAETFDSLAVSDNNKHVLAQIFSRGFKISRMMLFGVKGRALVPLTSFDLFDQRIDRQLLFQVGCHGNHSLWLGLSRASNETLVYDFDIESRKLRELREKRLYHLEFNLVKCQKLEDGLYYTGDRGSLKKIAVGFD